jgi:hypothetical protein
MEVRSPNDLTTTTMTGEAAEANKGRKEQQPQKLTRLMV